jgi:transposase-like protein
VGGTFAEAMMSADADQVCGAEYGTPSEDRVNHRNGYRHRDWDTRAGTIEPCCSGSWSESPCVTPAPCPS